MSRIFISHSAVNNAHALAISSWLDANGFSDYFLDIEETRGIAPGERWLAALFAAVDRCEAVVFLVSPAWRDSKYCFAEFFEAKKLGKRIFGLIVEPIALEELPAQLTAEWQVCDLTDRNDLESFVVSRLPLVPGLTVSFPRAGLNELRRGLRRAGLDPSTFVWPPEGERKRSPYPGLRALDANDAAVFFGREALVVRAIDQIRLVRERNVERLVVILGASGSGKSSFLRAGLLPRLDRDSGHFVVFPVIRPERAAISGKYGLLASLKGARERAKCPTSQGEVRADLARGGLYGLLEAMHRGGSERAGSEDRADQTLVIPIDQAEELFGADGGVESREFLDYIAGLASQLEAANQAPSFEPRLRVLLLLTIRSESLSNIQTEMALQALSPVLFSLRPMPASEFKAVIEGPAKRHTDAVSPLIVTPELTEQLIVDAQGADALPLLALTLEWLYREYTTDKGTRIGLAEYKRLGGVRAGLGLAVERAFERPDEQPVIPSGKSEQDQLLRQVFPYLATVDPDTGESKRRIAIRKKLPQVTLPLVERLVEQRLIRSDLRRLPGDDADTEIIEVAHEALLRQWDTLERWLQELGACLSASESVRNAAVDWNRNNRDAVLLVHNGHRLESAEQLLEDERLDGRFEQIDREYLAACRERERQQADERQDQLRMIAEQQRATAVVQTRFAWVLSLLALVIAGAAVWIVFQKRDVARTTSLVLAASAENSIDLQLYDQGLRLGVLAAKTSWLRPAHPNAAPSLSRAADGSALRYTLTAHYRPQGEDSPVISVGFSPNGKRMVTASDATARLWDAETGKPIGGVMRHGSRINSASFSPNGKWVVTASDDATARLWDAETGKPIGETMKHKDGVASADFSPDSTRVVTATYDDIAHHWDAHLWDAATGKPIGAAMKYFGRWLGDPSFSPDSKRLVMALDATAIRVLDAETGRPISGVTKHEERLHSVGFGGDSTRVITVTDDGIVHVWDVENGKLVGTMGPSDDLSSLLFPPTDIRFNHGRVLVFTGPSARVLESDTHKPIGEVMRHGSQINSASFSPDGKWVVTASMDRTAHIWDAETGKPIGEAMKHEDAVISAGFSPDSTRVATVSADDIAHLWDAATGKPVGQAMRHRNGNWEPRFSPDSKRVVMAPDASTAAIWDVETATRIGVALKHDAQVNSANFSPDGTRVVTASNDATVRIWDVETGKAVGEIRKPDDDITTAPAAAAFSPDGKRVLTRSVGGDGYIWEAFWPSISRTRILVEEVCRRKLNGDARRITESDIRASRILSVGQVGKDVCDDVAKSNVEREQ